MPKFDVLFMTEIKMKRVSHLKLIDLGVFNISNNNHSSFMDLKRVQELGT